MVLSNSHEQRADMAYIMAMTGPWREKTDCHRSSSLGRCSENDSKGNGENNRESIESASCYLGGFVSF